MTSNSSGQLRYEDSLSSVSSLSIDVAPPSFFNRLLISFYSRVRRPLAANSYERFLTGRKSTKRASYAQHPVTTADQRDVGHVTIDILPEDALLEMFDFYLHDTNLDAWHKLVHVCRKWRNVIFSSPRRLNLRLYCNARTPARKMLNIWPGLPIFLYNSGHEKWGMDNIFATFKHTDRICELSLFDIPSSQSEKVLAEMQQPFPGLTGLHLGFDDETPLVVPASFLGGSAPLLQILDLNNIPFPGLPKLLLSAIHLVSLSLLEIPYSGHFSPEVLVTCLSVLTRLESLRIGFKSPRSRAGQKSRHPPPRTLLPFLTKLYFKGVCEYLDDLVARIDAPLLDSLHMTFFNQLIFDTPQLAQFICHAPKIKAQHRAYVAFADSYVQVTLPQTSYGTPGLELNISCSQIDWQLSSLMQVCSSSFPQALMHTVEDLYISEDRFSWQDDIEINQWLEILHPFTAVKDLKLSWDFTRHIAPAVQELIGERTMEVLPALQTLSIDVTPTRDEPIPSEFPFPSQESIERFVVARKLVGHPITITVRRSLDENELNK